jgi:hypothetical protein
LHITPTADRNKLEGTKNPFKRLKESIFPKRGIRKEQDTSKLKTPVSLVGYAKRLENEGVIRLYPSLEFDHYFDISNNDIVRSEELPDSTIEFGGTRILLKKYAQVKHVKLDISKKQASFLEGKVVSEDPLNLKVVGKRV